jgi:ankyrin repeat protein
MTPTHMAAYAGDIGLLALFLDAGARLDARDSRGHSPLGLAIEQGRQEAAAWLRERGAGE